MVFPFSGNQGSSRGACHRDLPLVGRGVEPLVAERVPRDDLEGALPRETG